VTGAAAHARRCPWELLIPALLVVGAVAGALTRPLATAAAALGAVMIVVTVRWPRATALTASVAGPLYLSGFAAGPVTLDNVVVLAGAGVGTAWLLAQRRRMSGLAAWPLSVAVAVALAAAGNGGAGMTGLARFLSLAVLALVLVNSSPEVRRRTAAWAEAAVTLGALVVVAQPFTGYPDPYGTAEGVGQRFGGLFGHPNFAAYTVSLVLLYQLYTRRFTTARTASTGLLLLALVLTGSRAALLVFLLMLLPALWMRARRFFGLLLPALAALPFVGTTILTRLQSISKTGGLSGQNASGWRLGQWRDALAAAHGHEFLGIGWGQTASVLGDQLGAHSTYVQIWLELGRVGALVTAVGAVALLAWVRRVRVAQVMVAYCAVTGISDPVLLYPCCLTVLIVLLAHLLGERDAPGSAAAGATAGAPPEVPTGRAGPARPALAAGGRS
jgi:O-antigen ligase